jgi:hypothetical protein
MHYLNVRDKNIESMKQNLHDLNRNFDTCQSEKQAALSEKVEIEKFVASRNDEMNELYQVNLKVSLQIEEAFLKCQST